MLVAVASGLAVGLGAAPAGAESPAVLSGELATDGVYVAPERADVDEVQLVEQVKQARALGLHLVIVVANDPWPTPTAFARRILEASDADVALIFPPGGGMEADVVPELQTNTDRAVTAARAKADPVTATGVFTKELLAKPERSVPAVLSRTILAVLILAVVLGAAVMIEQGVRRGSVNGPLWSKPEWWSRAR